MSAEASTLDMDKLRKVRALMTGGKTEGERQAAQAKAAVLATRAGLTLHAALSKLDDTPRTKATSGNPSPAFDDWMEARQPGFKTDEAERRAEQKVQRLARCRALVAEYGSEAAVFAETDLEQRLRRALYPFCDQPMSIAHRVTISGEVNPNIWAAISAAAAMPLTCQCSFIQLQPEPGGLI